MILVVEHPSRLPEGIVDCLQLRPVNRSTLRCDTWSSVKTIIVRIRAIPLWSPFGIACARAHAIRFGDGNTERQPGSLVQLR